MKGGLDLALTGAAPGSGGAKSSKGGSSGRSGSQHQSQWAGRSESCSAAEGDEELGQQPAGKRHPENREQVSPRTADAGADDPVDRGLTPWGRRGLAGERGGGPLPVRDCLQGEARPVHPGDAPGGRGVGAVLMNGWAVTK